MVGARKLLVTWASAAALVVSASSARAGEPGRNTLPIHVVAVASGDAEDQADALTKALRGAVRTAPGWSLGPGDFSLEVLTLANKCADPPDGTCQTRIADQLQADRFIWGTLSKKGGAVRGTLHLWVRGKGTADVPLDYTANLTEANDEALVKFAESAVEKLTGGLPKGKVHVHTANVPGQVHVDGQPIMALNGGNANLLVVVGSHTISVKAPGFFDAQTQVVAKVVGPPIDVVLTLVPTQFAPEPTNWKKVGAYAAVGAGVVAGIAGLVSSLQVNGIMNDPQYKAFRMAQPASPDRCLDAQGTGAFPAPRQDIATLCSKGRTFELAQLVLYPLAAIVGGLGAYGLVRTHMSGSSASSVHITPKLGSTTGSLDVSYTW